MLRSIGVRAAVLVLALQACCLADTGSQDALAKASALVRAGKVKQAEALLRSASAGDPDSAGLHGALGELLFKQRRYENSVQELGLATQRDPDSPAYNLLLAEALIGWRHFGVAVDLLNAVKPKFGEAPQFHYDLGLAYYSLNKMNEAQAEFEETLRRAPNLERAQFLFAACLASTGDPKKATDILRKLVKERPKEAIYWLTLGQILGQTGDEDSAEAVGAVRRALTLAPHDGHTEFVASGVLTRAGDFAEARPLLEHLAKIDPTVLAVHVQLARVYSRLGQRDLARKESGIANELRKQGATENQPSPPGTQGGSEAH